MRTIGLIGGMSWQSSKLYYERINQLVADRFGGAHSAQIILNSLDFAQIARLQTEGRWKEAGAILANAAKSISPEPWVDRAGRLRGNLLALADILMGRSHPGRVLDL